MPRMTMDGKHVEAAEGQYLLDAARSAGIPVPTLCHHDALEPWGGCRLCVVEITRKEWNGWSRLVTACNYPSGPDLIVSTASDRVREARRVVLDLLLARCPETPLIRKLAAEYGIHQTSYESNPEPTDCILCGLCTRICDHLGPSAISAANRGAGREIAPPFGDPPPDCIGCLACAVICPTTCIPFEEAGSVRTIWKKQFEMLACAKCRKAHITKEQAEYFSRRSNVPLRYFDTCDECKRQEHAGLFNRLLSGSRVGTGTQG